MSEQSPCDKQGWEVRSLRRGLGSYQNKEIKQLWSTHPAAMYQVVRGILGSGRDKRGKQLSQSSTEIRNRPGAAHLLPQHSGGWDRKSRSSRAAWGIQ